MLIAVVVVQESGEDQGQDNGVRCQDTLWMPGASIGAKDTDEACSRYSATYLWIPPYT